MSKPQRPPKGTVYLQTGLWILFGLLIFYFWGARVMFEYIVIFLGAFFGTFAFLCLTRRGR